MRAARLAFISMIRIGSFSGVYAPGATNATRKPTGPQTQKVRRQVRDRRRRIGRVNKNTKQDERKRKFLQVTTIMEVLKREGQGQGRVTNKWLINAIYGELPGGVSQQLKKMDVRTRFTLHGVLTCDYLLTEDKKREFYEALAKIGANTKDITELNSTDIKYLMIAPNGINHVMFIGRFCRDFSDGKISLRQS